MVELRKSLRDKAPASEVFGVEFSDKNI